MKQLYLFFVLIFFLNNLYSQISTGIVPISKTYSSNKKFELLSISYDHKFPNLKGESFVNFTNKYDSIGKKKKIYKVDRSFDLYERHPFFAAISNDGRKIIYLTNYVYEKGKESKNVTYYVDGKLKRSFTTEEFIDCDEDKEKCELFYNHQNQIYDYRSATVKQYRKDASEKDIYLSKSFVFNKNDTIYLTDARKKVTLFDLDKGKHIDTNIDFDSIYPKLKNLEPIKSRISYYKYPYKKVVDLKDASNNEKLPENISKISDLKFVSLSDSTYPKYKHFKIELSGYLDRKGSFEIEKFEPDTIFDKRQIENYIKNTKFKTDFIPQEVDKIYVSKFYGGYRSYDDNIAKQETIKAEKKKEEEYKKRLTLEKIDGIYIPENLYESMTELDSILNYENKKQLIEAEDSWEFNSHLGGLGMWIRNNWGINGGSRLLKYFNDRDIGKGFFGKDLISGIIIEQYILWLKGDKTAWQKWEKQNPKK